MRNLLLAPIIALLFILITHSSSFAQSNDIEQQYGSGDIGFTLEPPQESIDEAVRKVKITFQDVSGNYKVCISNSFCTKGHAYQVIKESTPDKIEKYIAPGIDDDMINEDKKHFIDLPASGVIEVCGDGKAALKTDCKEDRDYFHAGNFYLATLFQEQGGKWFIAGRSGFYVNHHPPEVSIKALNAKSPEKFELLVKQNASLKDGSQNANNYQIIFEGLGIKEEVCFPGKKGGFVKKTPGTYTQVFPTDKWLNDGDNYVDGKPAAGVLPGTYIFKISDQNSEGGLSTNDCKGGFTHYHYICKVDSKKETKCEEIEDPNESDAKKFFALLDALNGRTGGVKLPCNKSLKTVKNPLDCPSIDTAIGTIELSPVGFITRLFSIILSLAGLGALLLIIYSGYRILLSRGNPEMLKGAKETLTSAIVGLLFIIFSLVILSIITTDILKIPGFG